MELLQLYLKQKKFQLKKCYYNFSRLYKLKNKNYFLFRLAIKMSKILKNYQAIGSELEILEKLDSPYLIKMIESFVHRDHLLFLDYSCIVTEFCDVILSPFLIV